jgi:hypothetical protein
VLHDEGMALFVAKDGVKARVKYKQTNGRAVPQAQGLQPVGPDFKTTCSHLSVHNNRETPFFYVSNSGVLKFHQPC